MDQINFHPLTSVPASKSILNRLLIAKSYFPILKIKGESQAEDVILLKNALANLNQKEFTAGSGGTTFRFLSLRLSRYPGEHKIYFSKQLADRPNQEISSLLSQLGVKHKLEKDHLYLKGGDWDWHDSISVNVEKSSQFLSAMVLNSWLLPKDLDLFFEGEMASRSYFQMTLEIMNYLGMKWEALDGGLRIKAKQSLEKEEAASEIDMSSAFVVASLAATTCEAKIAPFIYPSLQSDSNFLQVFEELGVPFMLSNNSLKILPAKTFRPIEWDLSDMPDLFPVLAVLCTLCEGQSKLSGLKNLKYKESNRLEAIAELLNQMGIGFEKTQDKMIINGNRKQIKKEFTSISTYGDHRIAFAAALAKLQGHNLKIENPDCVNKSFPGFWQQFNAGFPLQDLSK